MRCFNFLFLWIISKQMVKLELDADFVLERHLRRSEQPFSTKKEPQQMSYFSAAPLHRQLTWHRLQSGNHFCKLILNNYSLTDRRKRFQQQWPHWREMDLLCACQKYFQGWDPEDLWERLGPNQANFDLLEKRGGCLKEFVILSLKHANL